MHDAEDGRYQTARTRHAKRLAAEYLSQLEAAETQRPSDADAVSSEKRCWYLHAASSVTMRTFATVVRTSRNRSPLDKSIIISSSSQQAA